MRPSDPRHEYHISTYDLTPEIKAKLLEVEQKTRENDLKKERLEHDKKLGYLQLFHYSRATIIASCIGVLGVIGVTIYNNINAVKVNPETNKEILLMLRNIERNVIEIRKTTQTDHKLVNKLVFRLSKLYCEVLPNQCPDAFGHYRNRKGK